MNWIPYLAAVMPLGLFCLWLWKMTNGFASEDRSRAKEEGFGDE